MFRETALDWIAELEKDGKITPLDTANKNRVAENYAQRLEEILNAEVLLQLKRIGKEAEYERILIYDSQYA